jgi:inner membrane protein
VLRDAGAARPVPERYTLGMPSPVGHALGGLVFGWLVAGVPRGGDSPDPGAARRERRGRFTPGRGVGPLLQPWALGFAALGALADVDFLFGIHSRQTHSLGAIAIVFLVAACWGGRLDLRRGLACGLAYGSHVLFDWMGTDDSAPIGIMALWPFTDAFYQSDLHVFDAIRRRYWLPGFWAHNLVAVLREVAILVPVLILVWWGRRDRSPVPPRGVGPSASGCSMMPTIGAGS